MRNLLCSCGNDATWENIHIKYRESYQPPVDDFHEHNYYEINFIISGNVKILLPDCTDSGTKSRIVLTAPGVPHFVSCESDLLYSRFYLLFSKDFIKDCIPEWNKLLNIFGKSGKIVTVSPTQQDFCRMLLNRLQSETNPLRQKLLVLYLLSYIEEFSGSSTSIAVPSYVMKALAFIEEHCQEKLTAEAIAKRLYVGRTTLMTNFKKYTDFTLNNYIIQCRLKKALTLLRQGESEREIAEKCGFGDVSNLIRTFKKHFGTTPGKYIKKTM